MKGCVFTWIFSFNRSIAMECFPSKIVGDYFLSPPRQGGEQGFFSTVFCKAINMFVICCIQLSICVIFL